MKLNEQHFLIILAVLSVLWRMGPHLKKAYLEFVSTLKNKYGKTPFERKKDRLLSKGYKMTIVESHNGRISFPVFEKDGCIYSLEEKLIAAPYKKMSQQTHIERN
jgi:hypothetical protein